ncbi:unnamed protein product [Symbiodinium natans]|uniref:Uncharacterized protein n=1 Tax=Symbiodinium natans TaxID=878477 RepID=A0A812H3R3_9DINO|nr:unnamed protein product [Symbiodinium natans]
MGADASESAAEAVSAAPALKASSAPAASRGNANAAVPDVWSLSLSHRGSSKDWRGWLTKWHPAAAFQLQILAAVAVWMRCSSVVKKPCAFGQTPDRRSLIPRCDGGSRHYAPKRAPSSVHTQAWL